MKTHTQVENKDLDLLLRYVKRNNVGIPEFQRDFVWTKKKVIKLFDSMLRGFPIGSIIIWKTSENIGIKYIFTGNQREKSGDKILVIDGQQRLASIYYVLKQKEFQNAKGNYGDLFESFKSPMIDFSRFIVEGTKSNLELKFDKKSYNELDFDKLKRAIGKRYKIPVIVINSGSYKEAKEIFERINQDGTPISTEAIFLSEVWNTKSQLSKVLNRWKGKNKENISRRLDNIVFIHLFVIIIQLKEKRKDVDVSLKRMKEIAERIAGENSNKYEKELEMVLKAVGNSMEFLKGDDIGINTKSDLPSQTILTILGVFFYFAKSVGKTQKEKLTKWFWRSVLSDRYSGKNYNINIRKDPKLMMQLAKKEINSVNKIVKRKKLEKNELEAIQIDSGRSTLRRTVKLLLKSQGPRNLDGEKVKYSNVELSPHKKQNDHWISKKNLEDSGFEKKKINQICNMIYLSGRSNGGKSKLLPSEWLVKEKENLSLSSKDARMFFKSHLLPYESIKAVKRKEKKLRKKNGDINRIEMKKYYKWLLKERERRIIKALNSKQ